MHPHCVINIDHEAFRTKSALMEGPHPKYSGDTFTFAVNSKSFLMLSLWDIDIYKVERELGQAQIMIKDLVKKKSSIIEIPLT